tara:strand:- start:306 stop:587 length:282 start_codon:yes stop_codon:yes gene_type:complete
MIHLLLLEEMLLEIARLGCLEVPEILDFQAVQVYLEAQEFQVDLIFPEVLILIPVQQALAQVLYRVQLVRSCHLVLFYHQALFNNQVHIFPLE